MASTPLTALHGDSWSSPHFVVAIDGAGPDLAQWTIRAQAREDPASTEVLFDWAALGRIALGTARVRRGRDGKLAPVEDDDDAPALTLPAIQLRLRPADWAGKPRRWVGFLEVELSSDDTASPDQRVTLPRRRFEITSDIVR